MELRRNQMKYFSSDNMRLLSSLILSLSSKQSTMENKLIDYWTPSTAYVKDESMVIYDDAIQICKISNADDTFNQNKWLKLSPEIDELSVDTVKSWIGLTSEQIETLSKIILDSEVRLDKTWSSSKVYSSIQDAIDTSKAYTLAELGKASGASYRVVSSTTEMTDQKYIYLMSDGSGSYNMYIVEDDGSATQIGNTTIKLSDFYTKTETDNSFLKKTDAASTYATITTVDGKVDKTNVLTTASATATDEQVYSASAVNKSVSNQGIYSGDVNEIPMIKPDVLYSYSIRYELCTNLPDLCGHGILENIYLGSTDFATQRLTTINTKTVYIRVKGGGVWGDWIKLSTSEDKMVKVNGDVLEYIKNNPQKNLTIFWDTTDTNTPYSDGFTGSGGGVLISNVFDEKWGSVIGTCGGDFFCINRLMNGTWQGWEKLCATKATDVPLTNVPLDSSKFQSGNLVYEVKNGVCYVYIKVLNAKTTLTGYEMNSTPMPKPSGGLVTIPIVSDVNGSIIGLFYVEVGANSTPRCHVFTTSLSGYATLSYPVAES